MLNNIWDNFCFSVESWYSGLCEACEYKHDFISLAVGWLLQMIEHKLAFADATYYVFLRVWVSIRLFHEKKTHDPKGTEIS